LTGTDAYWAKCERNCGYPYAQYKYTNLGWEGRVGDDIDAAMGVWIEWNGMIEDSDPDLFWKLENLCVMDIHEALAEIGESRINLEIERALKDARTEMNPHRHGDITLDDLKSRPRYLQLKDTAARFGYDL
jgi:hypothetical protein